MPQATTKSSLFTGLMNDSRNICMFKLTDIHKSLYFVTKLLVFRLKIRFYEKLTLKVYFLVLTAVDYAVFGIERHCWIDRNLALSSSPEINMLHCCITAILICFELSIVTASLEQSDATRLDCHLGRIGSLDASQPASRKHSDSVWRFKSSRIALKPVSRRRRLRFRNFRPARWY